MKQTLDIAEEAEKLEETIDELVEEITEKVDRALELDPPEDEAEEEELHQVQEEYDELEASRVTLQGYVDTLRHHAEMWDGTEIVLKELDASTVRMAKTMADKDARKNGLDDAPAEFIELKMAEAFVETTPPGAPDPSDIGSLPDRLFNWVFGRGNALNTVGSLDMGNLSLRERMMERRS